MNIQPKQVLENQLVEKYKKVYVPGNRLTTFNKEQRFLKTLSIMKISKYMFFEISGGKL